MKETCGLSGMHQGSEVARCSVGSGEEESQGTSQTHLEQNSTSSKLRNSAFAHRQQRKANRWAALRWCKGVEKVTCHILD